MKDYPIRQASAEGVPKPETSIERRCDGCGASFLGLAPGKTGERVIWARAADDGHERLPFGERAASHRAADWFCSTECAGRHR